ncbi:hypothetical protein ACWD4P_17380 [Kitasatospora sp. NPDC002543]
MAAGTADIDGLLPDGRADGRADPQTDRRTDGPAGAASSSGHPPRSGPRRASEFRAGAGHDPAELVRLPFVPLDDALREAAARTEAFVRDEPGDARGFGLDSPKSRAPKTAALRVAGARVPGRSAG